MKLITSLLLSLSLLNIQCKTEKFSNCYKGRLEDIPNCGAPVVKILEGDLSGITHETNWQHPVSGENYSNVFVVRNYCDFQRENLDPGDEFYFVVRSTMSAQSCAICQALFPVPSKTNIIEVVAPRNCE